MLYKGQSFLWLSLETSVCYLSAVPYLPTYKCLRLVDVARFLLLKWVVVERQTVVGAACRKAVAKKSLLATVKPASE